MCLGRIGVISSVWDEDGIPMASVALGGREEPTCLMYAPDAGPGTPVLVELGFVVEVLDPAVAADAVRLRASEERSVP